MRQVIISTLFLLAACNSAEKLPTVKEVDLQKYAGKWYEIARLPNRFEKGLSCVTAEYTIHPNNIVVLNSGINEKGELEESTGSASQPDPAKPGELRVSFFWPFSSDYLILELASDYSVALVGSSSKDYLWLLSRTPELPNARSAIFLETAVKLGYDLEKLEWIKQDCNR
ncbi:MAG: hypothetical protein RL226_2109 [Bacteroidota bacterium]|jgi:lipocalin